MSQVDYSALKQGGVMKQIQPDLFAIRVKVRFGNLTTEEIHSLAAVAEEYGSGVMHLTVRQCVEIQGVRYEDIDKARGKLAGIGFELGACGPRVRVVTACPGERICPQGIGDTAALASALDERFYAKGPLPHKFKMAVTGCPNACIKPQENDVGFTAAVEPRLVKEECISCALCEKVCPAGAISMVEGFPVIDLTKCTRDGKCIQVCPTGSMEKARRGWVAYAGGKFGRNPQLAYRVADFVSDEEAVATVERILELFQREASQRERLGDLINRIGLDSFKEAISVERR